MYETFLLNSDKQLSRQAILEQIKQTLKKEKLSISDVCYFMQPVRLLIEIDGIKQKYKTTNHYCNWLLNKELNRSSSHEFEFMDAIEDLR